MNPWMKLLTAPKDPTEAFAPNPAANASFVTQQTGGVGMDDPLRQVAQNAQAISQMGNPYGLPMSGAPGADGGESPTEERHGNTLDTRNLLQGFVGDQSEGIKRLQEAADVIQGKAKAREGQADLSPLLALNDSLHGTNLAKSYLSPEDEKGRALQAEEMVQKARQPLTQDIAKEYQTENSAENAYLRTLSGIAKAKAGQVTIPDLKDEVTGAPVVLEKNQLKTAKEFHDAVFLGRGANSEVKQSISKLRSAAQFDNLISAIPQAKPNSAEMSDLTTALANVVNNTNATTDHKFTSLYPSSMALTASKIAEWLTAEPHGVNQTEWIKRWKNEVNAERGGANKALNAWVDSQVEHYAGNGLLPEALVNRTANAAKKFYKSGYAPMTAAELHEGGAGLQGAGGALTPPVPGAKLQQNKSGQKSWLMPDGKTRIPIQ